MTYCKPGWTIDCLPIRSITYEEYHKELETDVPDIKSEVNDLGISKDLEEYCKLTDISKAIGTGRLMRYSNCQYGGDYSGFKKDNFLYLNWKNSYLKIRVDCRDKVADEIVELANYIRTELI